MTAATGWAVVDSKGKIDVCTVHGTRRGAIVNWLVRQKSVMIYESDSDQDIEDIWSLRQGESICTTVSITVTPR